MNNVPAIDLGKFTEGKTACLCLPPLFRYVSPCYIRRYVLKAVALWVGYPTGCIEVLVVSSFPVYLNAAVRACLCG